MNIKKLLIEQLNQRHLFYSEDDFKLALAWKIKELHPDWEVLLEKPVRLLLEDRLGHQKDQDAPIDIILINPEGNEIPIELKYKTKEADVKHNGFRYELKNQSAHPEGRFRFIRDVVRIEKYLSAGQAEKGYAVMLTNDRAYMRDVSETDNYDKNYSLHNGRSLGGTDGGWNYKDKKLKARFVDNGKLQNKDASGKHWTYKGDNAYKLDLSGRYQVQWNTFSHDVQDMHYCIIEVLK